MAHRGWGLVAQSTSRARVGAPNTGDPHWVERRMAAACSEQFGGDRAGGRTLGAPACGSLTGLPALPLIKGIRTVASVAVVDW